MTSVETELRRGLAELAEEPGPLSVADQALARARRMRARRGLTAVAALALVATAVLAVGVPGVAARMPWAQFGGAPGTNCGTSTDEANPPQGVSSNDWPEFVAVAVSLLPPRDDYTLQSSNGLCAPGGGLDHGYAVVNLGPNREHGHLTLNLDVDPTFPATCDAVSAPAAQVLFCEESTVDSPMILAIDGDYDYLIVSAGHGDARVVRIEAIGTPLDAAALRSAVTSPSLARLIA